LLRFPEVITQQGECNDADHDPPREVATRVSRQPMEAYTLELPSGPEVFAQPFDRPGDRIQVSVKGGFGPVWRDDGRELYYEGPQGLMAVPMTERGGALQASMPQVLFRIHTQGSVFSQPHNVEVGRVCQVVEKFSASSSGVLM